MRDFGQAPRAIAAQACRCCLARNCWRGGCGGARAIGYPVMLKSTAGGGGVGMRLAASERIAWRSKRSSG
jgi:hypothetical protein